MLSENVKRQRITGVSVPEDKSKRDMEAKDGLTVEQFITRSVLDLKKIAPFFFAALYVVPRIESNEIEAIAVSIDKLYYNPEFVATLTREEMTFYLIHGLYHIIMRHHLRGKGRDPVRWNKACDMYINRCITESYGVRPGELTKIITGPGEGKAPLCMPVYEYYDNTINIKEATPEKIYEQLPVIKRGPQGEPEDKDKLKVKKGSMDLVDDSDNDESETSEIQKAERILKKIQTTYDQVMKNVQGHDVSFEKVTEAQIDKELQPTVNWRAILQNRLVAMKLDEKSLSHPDKRFVYRKLYVEGPVTEEEELSGIKICVDTSGSMSDDEIAEALYQIRRILQQYHAKADLVFWDEVIESITPFESIREFEVSSKEAAGRGGTNPNCIFEEFTQKNVRGHENSLPNLVLIFTDGDFDMPDKKYAKYFNRNTIWVVCPNSPGNIRLRGFDPGFGKIVLLKNTKEKRMRHGTGNLKHAHSADLADYITT